MSSYFDKFDREVYELAQAQRAEAHDDKWFLEHLEAIESCMVRDCELFAGDMETPEDVRQCIMAVIALGSVEHNPNAREMALCMKRSQLSQDMHSLFHDIARMRYSMRYGLVFDDPAAAVQHRDDEVMAQHTDKHRARRIPLAEQPTLILRDSPGYCKKVVAKVKQPMS